MLNMIKIFILGAVVVSSGCVTSSGGDEKEAQVENLPISKMSTSKPVDWRKGAKFKNSGSNETEKKIFEMLVDGHLDRAISHSHQYLKKKPDSVFALQILASAHALQSELTFANFYADKLLTIDQGNSIALNIKGLHYSLNDSPGLDKFREAARYFKAALDQNPNHVAAAMNLGDMYLKLAKPDQALDIFKQAVSRCDSCLGAHVGMATSHYQLGKFDEALKAAENGLDINDADPKALYIKALILGNGMGDRTNAVAALQEIVDNSNSPESYKEKAYVQIRYYNSINLKSKKVAKENEKSADKEGESNASFVSDE